MKMNHFFLQDFSFWHYDDLKKTLLNPIDLLDRKSLQKLLQICQNQGESCYKAFSDYELFRALCDNRQLFSGHATMARYEYILNTYLGIDLSVSSEKCKEIWKKSCSHLMQNEISVWTFVQKKRGEGRRCLFPPNKLLCDFPQGLEPVLDGTAFYVTSALIWDDWKNEMHKTLDFFEKAGCKSVYFYLDKTFLYREPNLYSVETVLQAKRHEEEKNLLIAQVFRFLSEYCTERNLTLILRAECQPQDCTSLLMRTERTVGLPSLIWTAASPAMRDLLLDFTFQKHKNTVQPGFVISDYPSEAELRAAFFAYIARYPLGQLAIFSGSDLLGMGYERYRFEPILKSVL